MKGDRWSKDIASWEGNYLEVDPKEAVALIGRMQHGVFQPALANTYHLSLFTFHHPPTRPIPGLTSVQ